MSLPKPKVERPFKRTLLIFGLWTLLVVSSAMIAYHYVDPAPPKKLVISTSAGEGDYQVYAKLYQTILKEDGITLDIRPSSGATENLRRLKDPKSDIDAAFVQDGLGSPEEAPDLMSLGSLYYEPIWVFYGKGIKNLTRFSDLIGRKIAIGPEGGGTRALAHQILAASGINEKNSQLKDLAWNEAAESLQQSRIDAAFFVATADEPLIKRLMSNPNLHLMNVDQAEAISRRIPFLHHLILPHGVIDLQKNLPAQDIHLLSPTATLLVKDSLHPALIYLLLKAASQTHDDAGIFEKKGEFPIDKDYQFPLSLDAQHFYKSGVPFWQRYLPFWLAILVERFILIVIPLILLILPIARAIPKLYSWRIKSKIYQRYGELKFLETQVVPGATPKLMEEHLQTLDKIEERVNRLKIPLEYSDHLYALRGHIDFVRERLRRTLAP